MTSQRTTKFKDLNSGRHVILYDQLYTERGELVALQKGFKKNAKKRQSVSRLVCYLNFTFNIYSVQWSRNSSLLSWFLFRCEEQQL